MAENEGTHYADRVGPDGVTRSWAKCIVEPITTPAPTPHAGVTVTDEVVEVMATVICYADDSMYHHDRTDDMPCSACKSIACVALTASIPALRAQWAEEVAGGLPTPPREFPSLWCRDCGPGYRVGDEGCRHGSYQPEVGEQGVCRTCAQPIWWEPGTIGHRERVGWSDRIDRGGDSVICFKAADYRHVPMGGREAAIYRAGVKAGDPS